MNILSFDIEDWFHCDFISDQATWTNYTTRIHESTDRILHLLEKRNLKGTFFILGWIADKYPEVVKKIYRQGHEVGCHSHNHDLVHRMNPRDFLIDTEKSLNTIEDIIGEKVVLYRAPGFSITENTPWAFEILHQLGITIDCSVFPAKHDYGGFPNYGESRPSWIKFNGTKMKEFPMSTYKKFNSNVVFSGGGFFRLFPYPVIKKWTRNSPYVMTYFHPRDFDDGQPMLPHLPLMRKFKSYYGLKGAFLKFEKWLNQFETMSLMQADEKVNWDSAKIISLQ